MRRSNTDRQRSFPLAQLILPVRVLLLTRPRHNAAGYKETDARNNRNCRKRTQGDYNNLMPCLVVHPNLRRLSGEITKGGHHQFRVLHGIIFGTIRSLTE
jgi:hypothetical protein